jgi:hypothetical protein
MRCTAKGVFRSIDFMPAVFTLVVLVDFNPSMTIKQRFCKSNGCDLERNDPRELRVNIRRECFYCAPSEGKSG